MHSTSENIRQQHSSLLENRFSQFGLQSFLAGHRLRTRISQWLHNYRTRRQLARLAELPDYLLKDIGVSQAQAQAELDKPFWRD